MTDNATAPAIAESRVRFIRDVPADDDFFKTHSRVAEAIVRAIEENPEIKVIGLLGRWGSGKSTVANQVIKLLEGPENSKFEVFPYDAWLHQSDPLRRSFLESLILALVRTKAIAPRKWTKKLRKLNRPVEDASTIETPVLSPDARWLALSLLATPIGLGLLGFETVKAAFGPDASALGLSTIGFSVGLIILPALVWGALYVKRRPWSQFFDRSNGFRRKAFWQSLDEDGEPTGAVHIFMDGPAKQTSTRTFRSNEPTSLEFGRMFQKIMREVDEGGHRLVILIDNLDRVAASEALGMWATIRSFFLASDETEDAKPEPFHPTVILPIDRHAVEDLFAGSDEGDPNGGRDRARSFMDKTFDVTFEVTEPVHSDWRNFLAQQMEWMFGEAFQARWAFWTRRLFESQLARQLAEAGSDKGRPSAVVTPREINKLLNRVGALYLQWASSGIPVEVMALYVIRRHDIDQGILKFLQSDDVEIADVAPEWKRQLAALHYGVEPEKAAQVLLEEPIRTAIVGRDQVRFTTLSTIPGFGEILEYTTADLPEPSGSSTPFDILANAVLLLHGLKLGGYEWSNNAWRNLVLSYSATAHTVTPGPSAVEIIKLLSEHVLPEARESFISTSAALISRIVAKSQKGFSEGTALRAAAEHLIEFSTKYGIPHPLFELPVEPQVFVTRLSEASSSRQLWPLLRTGHVAEALKSALEEMLGTTIVQRSVPSAVRCLTLEGGVDLYSGDAEIEFEGVVDKATQLVRAPESPGMDFRPGIRVLAELAYDPDSDGAEALSALVDDGFLATRMNSAFEGSDWPTVALLISVMIWRGKKFDPPAGLSWYQYPQRDPEHQGRIVRVLQLYFPGKLVPILWASHKAGYAQASFVETIIAHAVETDTLGSFDAAEVLADLHEYKRAVPYRLRDKFLQQVDKRANFLTALDKAPLGPQTVEVIGYLRRKGGEDAVRADAFMRTYVEQADDVMWTTAIRLGDELYGVGQAFIKSRDLTFGRKSGLYDALAGFIPILTQSAGREMRVRWFTLTDLLKTKDKKAILRALGDAVGGASPAQGLSILKAGGVEFLKSGGFAARADQSVRTIILPQLVKKVGRDWLKDNRDELAVWVQRAEPKTREELSAVLNRMIKSKQEDRQYTADMLSTRWS